MTKKKLLISMFLILLIMGGCNSEEQLPEEEIVFYDRFTLGKDGILYCSDLLYITDYATGVTVPLCNRPNCAHEPFSSANKNSQCNAAFKDSVRAAFIYHDKLYIFVFDGLNHTTVYMAESTGEGRQKIAEADFDMWAGYYSYFHNGKFYFEAQRESYHEDNSLQREVEYFISSFDVAHKHFEILTTPTSPNVRGIHLAGIANGEIYYARDTYKGSKEDWLNVSVEYIAKNLETGEERNFFEGEDIVDHLGDYCVVETGIYYILDKDGTYEYWKKDTDGNEIFIYSADDPANFKPIINGEALFEKDKSDFQKEVPASCICGDMVLVMDGRKGYRHGIMTLDNYLNDIDEIVYPEFPNMIYYSEYEIVEP